MHLAMTVNTPSPNEHRLRLAGGTRPAPWVVISSTRAKLWHQIMDFEHLQLLIDGEWTGGAAGRTIDVIDPSNEEVIAELPVAEASDLDRALDGAQRGFRVWRAASAFDRAKVLHRAADLVRERHEAMSRTVTMEQGKPLAEARAEITGVAEFLDWAAEEGRRLYGRLIPARSPGMRQMVIHEPVGPVAAFTPWNFPGTATVRKIAGSLAAGCSCIIKPSEETPGTCIAIARALVDAGLPKGVLNLVCGTPDAVARHLIASPIIRKISFTGSVPVGRHLARLAADGLKTATLELGGHSPVIVCDDSDVERTADLLAFWKFRNAGQVCVSPTRFFVQARVHDAFLDRFVRRVEGIRLGSGLEDATTMGPMANERRLEAMAGFVDDAVGKGARLVTGGHREGNRGYFHQPTVIADVPCDARIMNEEPFGPVVPVFRFDTLDEALTEANRLQFGLAGYAFTRSLDRATRIGDELEVGMVGINNLTVNLAETPFGGVKDSGYGRESGPEGIEAYTTVKYISQAAA